MQMNFHFESPNYWKKFFITLVAIIFMGVFLSFLIVCNWGTDPASFMNLNISSVLGCLLGTWQLCFNFALLLIMFIFDKSLIGAGTILNMVLIGYTADFCYWLERISGLEKIILSNLPLRIGVFSISIILFVIAAAIYMNTQMGLSPYDGVCKIITNKLYKLPFAPLRMVYDGFFVVIGVCAGIFFAEKMVGSVIGAIFMVFMLGPAISLIGKWMKNRFSIFKE